MLDKVIIKNAEINSFIKENNYADAAKVLLEKQKQNWQQLSDGYESLKTVKVKTFQFEGFKIKVQFNPGRIASSSAKIDSKSIKERKCFLCEENLPSEQRGILYKNPSPRDKNDFLILCNPYPIFPEHFTLANIKHVPQQIKNSFTSLLNLSKDLFKRYTVFYNGPKCGASAPDHLHFQAGNKFFMPIDDEFQLIKNEYGKILTEHLNGIAYENLIVSAVNDGLRKFISIETNDLTKAEKVFDKFYKLYETFSKGNEEPMMNIISFYDGNPSLREKYGETEEYEDGENYRILIFLREKHRPSHYFAEGENNILLSPAAVDLGGVCIIPLEKDFNKITKENIIEIFNEISVNEEKFNKIVKNFKDELRSFEMRE